MSTFTPSTGRPAAAPAPTDAGRPAATGGTFPVLAAACLWGTTGTVRTYLPAAATDGSVAAVRIVLGGAVLVAVAAALDRGAGLRHLLRTRRNRPLVGLAALAMATYQAAFFSAASRTGVAIATITTIGSAPAFAGVLRLATRQAPATRRWLVATTGAVVGCAVLVGGGRGAGAEPAGIGLALLSGLAYAVYATVLSLLIARGEDERAATAGMFGGAMVVMLPLLLTSPTGWAVSGSGAAIAVYLGAVTTAGGYLLFARGLRSMAATTATTLTLAEPAVAALLGVVVLDEGLGGPAVVGLALLVASLAVLAWPVPSRPKLRQLGAHGPPN